MRRHVLHLRLVRLKQLAGAVDRLPPSRARDRLLRDVRSRAVAADTGPEQPSGWRGRPGGSGEPGPSDGERLERLLDGGR